MRHCRIALYSHDAMGLGHVRRNMLLAQAFASCPERPAVLLITGAREAATFAMPPGVDCLALPALHKEPGGTYRSRTLDLPPAAIVGLRAATIRAALDAFEPDLFVVDNVPCGAEGELMPAPWTAPGIRACSWRRAAAAITRSVLLVLFFGPAVPLARGQTPLDEAEIEQPRDPAARARLGLDFRMSGVFDSNVDHDEGDLDSYGAMMAARVQFRTRRFSMQYHTGVDRFSQTVRWDRVTHRLRADVRQRITSRWRANTLAEVSVGHSSDDRELVANQYTVMPELEHRIDDARRLYAFGSYRFRRFGDRAELNDAIWYWGGEFRHDAGGRQSWAAGYRYEASDAPVVRSSYTRHAYVTAYRVKTTSRDELLLGLTSRPRQYPHRLLELSTGAVLRRDRRWTPSIAWVRLLPHGLRMEAVYTFDRQTSNEQSKNFRAHRVAYAVGWVVR